MRALQPKLCGCRTATRPAAAEASAEAVVEIGQIAEVHGIGDGADLHAGKARVREHTMRVRQALTEEANEDTPMLDGETADCLALANTAILMRLIEELIELDVIERSG